MSRKAAKSPKNKKQSATKTARKSASTPALIPQPNGRGALLSGGMPGNKGGGRTPDAVRHMALDASIDEVVPKLRHIVRTSYEEANVISAGRELLKVAIPTKQEVDIMNHPEAQRFTDAYRAALADEGAEVFERVMQRVAEKLGRTT